jgi:hypothetical protein
MVRAVSPKPTELHVSEVIDRSNGSDCYDGVIEQAALRAGAAEI